MKPGKKFDFLFWLIILVYLGYAGFYIYQTSFMVGSERYFVLFDDAMISMRYAKNLAEGFGPVWNPGEIPVEGYTNPLWVAIMAIFHLFPIPASKMSLPIQISGGIFLACNLYFVKQIISRLTPNKVVTYLALIMTAFYMPLNNWGLQGMEVSLLVMLASAAVWLLLTSLEKETFSPWPFILLAVGTLVRIDMVVPYLVIFGSLLILKPKWAKNTMLWGLGLLVVSILGQTLLRYWYYGDLLPNTYYLKMEGFPLITRVKRGILVLFKFIIQMNWVLVLLPFVFLIFKFNQTHLLLALVISGQIAYSVYVGGDAWEHQGGSNRYISIAMPLFFSLFVYALHNSLKTISTHTRVHWIKHPATINLFTIAISLLAMYNFNFFLKTSQRTLDTWMLKRQPIFVEANIEYVNMVLAIDQITTPEATLAVVSAGSIPYFTERPTIDLLGKNDRTIAHQQNHLPNNLETIRPGHMKWDYDYAIGELKPDLIVQLWGDDSAAIEYIEKYYTAIRIDDFQFYALSDSIEIFWDSVESLP